MATSLGYCIQFRPYAGKDTILQEYTDIGLGLGASVVAHVVKSLPEVENSNYHVVMDNFFTSPKLLRYLKSKGICSNRNSPCEPDGEHAFERYEINAERGS